MKKRLDVEDRRYIYVSEAGICLHSIASALCPQVDKRRSWPGDGNTHDRSNIFSLEATADLILPVR